MVFIQYLTELSVCSSFNVTYLKSHLSRLCFPLCSCASLWSSASLCLPSESIPVSLWSPACMRSSSPSSGTRYHPHKVCTLTPMSLWECNDWFLTTAMMHQRTDTQTSYLKLWWTIPLTTNHAQTSKTLRESSNLFPILLCCKLKMWK